MLTLLPWICNSLRLKDSFFAFFFFFFFLGSRLGHMEFPRLGVQSELQLLTTATATATQDPGCICDLHHTSQQGRILNPLKEARDRTRNLIVPSQICFCCAMTGTPRLKDSNQFNLYSGFGVKLNRHVVWPIGQNCSKISQGQNLYFSWATGSLLYEDFIRKLK